MRTSFFTQSAIVLTEMPLDTSAVESALADCEIAKYSPAEGEKNWLSGYPSWTVAMRPEVNGAAVVEIIDAPWPDHMGDPAMEPGLFGAWSVGLMGSGAWPGGLARAIQYNGLFGRKATAEAAQRHGAFVRINASYVLGPKTDDTPIYPPDYKAMDDLHFVTRIASAVLHAPGAICYFNTAGETLYSASELAEMIKACKDGNIPPLPIWVGDRMVKIDDALPWMVADIIGMGQFDLNMPDLEACFQRGTHDANEIRLFLRNLSFYMLNNFGAFSSGHTTDGPGGVWKVFEFKEGLIPAPRRVLRWFPQNGSRPPQQRLPPSPPPLPKKPGKGFFGRLFS